MQLLEDDKERVLEMLGIEISAANGSLALHAGGCHVSRSLSHACLSHLFRTYEQSVGLLWCCESGLYMMWIL